jgi:hypothetical protein
MYALRPISSQTLSRVRLGLHRRRAVLLALLAYSGLAVFMTWPIAGQLTTHLAGGRDDIMTHQWTFWWIKQALAQGMDPFYSQWIFYPNGVTLLFHNIAWLNIAAWLPLQAVLGSIPAYNLLFIVTFALNGFTTFLLGREWTKAFWPAFVGGLVWGYWPAIQSHYDHPNMIAVFWIPLTLLYLKRAIENGRTRDAVLAGIFLGLTGVTRVHLLIMGAVLLALFVASKLVRPAYRTWRTVKQLLMMGVVAGVLLAPILVPMIIGQITRAHPEDIFVDEQTAGQTDLLAYVLPPPDHLLATDAIRAGWKRLGINRTYDAFIGYVVIALAVYGAIRQWPSARFWVLAALVYFGLALGPELRVNGHLYSEVPMPYQLVEGLFRVLRKPDRFNVLLGLPIAMLVAFGVQSLLQQRRLSRHPAVVGLAACLLILAEYRQAPFPNFAPATPAWFNQLAQEPGRAAILDLPMDLVKSNKWYMFYQITHGKPLVEGRVSRVPREAFAFMREVPLLQQLRRSNRIDPELVDISRQLRQLSDADVRYIVLHKKFATPEQLANWRDWLTAAPNYEDDELVVYRTDPQLGHEIQIAQQLTADLGLVRAGLTPTATTQTGFVDADVRWASTTAPDRDYNACLSLVDSYGTIGQAQCEPVVHDWPTSEWGAASLARGAYSLQVDPFLAPGLYTLTLTINDQADGSARNSPYALGQVQVAALPRVFKAPEPVHSVNVRYADAITLLGYEAVASSTALTLTLDWQADRRMNESYKVFVHVVDSTSGAVVAQADSVPRQWTYPTNWWEQSEIVRDAITVPLDTAPPGRYVVKIGLYDLDTAQRLPAQTAGGLYPDGSAPLMTIDH